MNNGTRKIAIFSGKGGVGKTTTAVNLGACLYALDKEVMVVDTNLVTPNLGLHLGFPPNEVTINDVLRGKAGIEEAVHAYDNTFKVIPAGISLSDSGNHLITDFKDALSPLSRDYDMIIMDCGAGLWGDVLKAVKIADEALIVTNPELTAAVDSLKGVKMAERLGVKVSGIIVNKVTGASYELKNETISGILKGYPILAKIPFDRNVPRSISMRKPLVNYKPRSPAARGFKKLAHNLIGEEYSEGFFEKLRNIFSI